jgi:FkbH-like protein
LAKEQNAPNIFVTVEWFDLDPRLGIRSLGGWGSTQIRDVVETAGIFLRQLREALSTLSPSATAVLSLPNLPLPPVFKTHTTVLSTDESRLLRMMADLAAWAAGQSNLRVLHRDALAEVSPMRERWDMKSDLASGFPYTTAHADVLASIATSVLLPNPRRKGIISDLDDTFWAGIVGEVGVSNVTWTLEHGTQIHGLYQQLLASLAETGILIAIASKNDPDVAREALAREDLLIAGKALFPVDVHWGAKSESVARILKAWNVGAASVVFIDDSELELAEVRSAFPEMECIRFPKESAAAALQLLRWLRDEFGRESANEEDKIRRESLQRAEVFQTEAARIDPEEFLRSLGATVTIAGPGREDRRAFELVNKTNQFNINGSRYTWDAWISRAERLGDFVLIVAYEDRFGPLGKIAVMAGTARDRRVELEDWVISCRAFSRRIEYQCLRSLFETFDATEMTIRYKETARNGPSRDLLKILCDSLSDAEQRLVLSRERFENQCPMLYHKIRGSGRSDRREAEAVLQSGVPESK